MLDRLHKISEIVAAFAIVGSLIFVGVQMNQNTDALRASFIQSSIESWNTHAMAIATDEGLTASLSEGVYPEIREKVYARHSTSDAQLAMWLYASFRTTETLFLQWQAGHIPDDVWLGYREGLMAGFVSNQTYSVQWDRTKGRMHPRFSAYVDALRIEAEQRRAKFLGAAG